MTGMRALLSVAGLTLFLAGASSAQEAKSGFSIGVGGGFAQGDQGIGYTLLSTLEFPSPFRAVKPRLDAFYSNWGRWPNVAGLTANVLVTPFSTTRVAPYLLVGGGAYLEENSNPKAGATFGLGLRLPGALRTLVIESQAHVYLLEHPRGQIYAYTLDGPQYEGFKRATVIWKPIGLTIQF
jgi:hypothetical protein